MEWFRMFLFMCKEKENIKSNSHAFYFKGVWATQTIPQKQCQVYDGTEWESYKVSLFIIYTTL